MYKTFSLFDPAFISQVLTNPAIIFVAGRSNGGTNDFSVTRVYDSSGAFIWRGQDMIEGRGITLTPNDEVITGGERNASTNTIQIRNQTTGELIAARPEFNASIIINTVAAASDYYVKGRNGVTSNTILKLDVATAALIWARATGAGINRIEIDSAENVWVAHDLDLSGFSIRKYDAAGTLLLSFTQTDDNSGGAVTFNSIKVDNAGFIHTASNRFTGNIVKWDVDFASGPGQIIWQQTHGATVRCITVDADGNVYAAGDESGGVTTRKYNSSGTLQWTANHGATVRGITVDEDGNVYTTGDRVSSVTTRKYNSTGTLQWSLDYGDTTYDITNTTQF